MHYNLMLTFCDVRQVLLAINFKVVIYYQYITQCKLKFGITLKCIINSIPAIFKCFLHNVVYHHSYDIVLYIFTNS